MKNSLFFFSALLLLISQEIKAGSILGGDITWKCRGNDTFDVTVTLYRDCNGSVASVAYLAITPTCGGSTVYFGTQQSGGIDVTPICKAACTRCSSGSCAFPFGIQQYLQTA